MKGKTPKKTSPRGPQVRRRKNKTTRPRPPSRAGEAQLIAPQVPGTSTTRPPAPAGEIALRRQATQPQRGPDGRFLLGNRVARTHGLTGADDPVAWPPPEDFLADAVVNDGGERIAIRRKSLLEYRARVHRRIIQLDEAIEARGAFDRQGRVRESWLQLFPSLIDRAQKLDQFLGVPPPAEDGDMSELTPRELDMRLAALIGWGEEIKKARREGRSPHPGNIERPKRQAPTT